MKKDAGQAGMTNRNLGEAAPRPDFSTLNVQTPTRLIYNGHLTLALEFHMLIRQLLRRISLLSYFHGGIDISGCNFKGIIEKAKEVTVIKRK